MRAHTHKPWFAFVALVYAALLWVGCNQLLNNNSGQLATDGGPGGNGDGSSNPNGDSSACCTQGDGGTPGNPDSGPCPPNGCNPPPDAACGANCNPGPDGSPPPPPPCDGAACTPVAIATGQPVPWALAVDGTTVYFTNNGPDGGTGGVASVPIGGGNVMTYTTGLKHPADIALDANNVYWISHDSTNPTNGYGDIATVPKTGGSPAFVIQGLDDDLDHLAVYGGNFYYSLNFFGDIFVQLQGQLMPTQLTSNLENVGGMQVDSTGLYATVGGDTSYSAAIVNVWLDGGVDLYDYPSSPVSLGGIAIDGTHCYYTNASDGTIDMVAKSGNPVPPPMALAYAQNNPSQIAVDSFYVYWTVQGTAAANYTDGKVRKIAITGGNAMPITLADNQKQPRGIAVDQNNVYWTNMGDGTVMQRAK